MIDSAIDQYAIENNKNDRRSPSTRTDWTAYMKKGSTLYMTAAQDFFGNGYGP